MPSDVATSMLAGGLAGALETTLTYPLDLAKTRQQLSLSSSETVPQVLNSAFREQGFRGLYQGLGAPLISEVPRRALKFAANDAYKGLLTRARPAGDASLVVSVVVATMAGAAAGGTETLLHTPFEVVKIRMQAKTVGPSAPGMLRTASQVVHTDGLSGLYVGLGAYALRQIAWNGAFFGFIGLGKASLPNLGGSTTVRDFLLGLLAGSAATCINNPLDVAKSRIQFGDASGGLSQCRGGGVGPVLLQIARLEGVRGLCKGLPARLYRSAPGHGLLYMGFEFFAGLLREGGVAR
eukprot:CAMPEP_0117480798 /NCGR_PEP_ID=MMETSP0784-20121206/12573_1 /TAXON_ID=39447 /ORGANISM="" /LENGTH=293 /DNA_ID=CAMNT_0005275241 /DNA_START=5 /DNA_END=886 /DNA_ORIENTATION=-